MRIQSPAQREACFMVRANRGLLDQDVSSMYCDSAVERLKADRFVYREWRFSVIAGLDANRTTPKRIHRLANRSVRVRVSTSLRSGILPIHKHDSWLQNPR